MESLSNLGISLSLVFGFLFLALFAELYYLLWWKKRITTNNNNNEEDRLLCFRKISSLCSSTSALTPQQTQIDLHLLKPPEEGGDGGGAAAELMRLHNLSGPPRFLFTIKEETKEDLECLTTPLSSPPLFRSPLTPMDCFGHNKFNPLFDSSGEIDWNRVRSSPPPKFKFLMDAEEKFYRKTLMAPPPKVGDEDGAFVTVFVGKSRERSQQQHSSSSQVLPLASSPV
ncbi:hypothetical protein QJS10_CPB14g01518 [Acorus calamus]|uniref:Uncharacterized protein n=1 Tax=Acorus calamus TaxID=4465 RepID=A0AAV9DAQ8_ACOCL|nr:hypothetical protein QJS10_CPB14g01518 [Acorus calamus]